LAGLRVQGSGFRVEGCNSRGGSNAREATCSTVSPIVRRDVRGWQPTRASAKSISLQEPFPFTTKLTCQLWLPCGPWPTNSVFSLPKQHLFDGLAHHVQRAPPLETPSPSSSSSLLLSSLELSDTTIYEPSIRARLRTASHFCHSRAGKASTTPQEP